MTSTRIHRLWSKCTKCDGTGGFYDESRNPWLSDVYDPGAPDPWIDCFWCEGSGIVPSEEVVQQQVLQALQRAVQEKAQGSPPTKGILIHVNFTNPKERA